jgi:hypothetical protein
MINLDSRKIRQKCKVYLQKVQKLTRITLAGETSGHVNAGPVSADAVHDRALVDVDASHVVLVQSVTLKSKTDCQTVYPFFENMISLYNNVSSISRGKTIYELFMEAPETPIFPFSQSEKN